MKQKRSSRLRRPMQRSFELMVDLNRPHSPACPTLPEDCGSGCLTLSAGGRTSGREGRLRSARGRNSLAIAAEGGDSSFPLPKDVAIRYQASQRRLQGQGLIIFEQTMPDGMSDVTDKTFDALKPEDRHPAGLGRARITIAGGISGRRAQEKTFLPLPPAGAGYAGSSRPSTTNPPEKQAAKTAVSGRWKK
jgi:hypothetical protein